MADKGEQWMPVVGYEGWYDVSDHGHVRRVKPGKGTHVGRVIKPLTNAYGYHKVTLVLEGRNYQMYIHRMILESFVGSPPEGKPLACHKNDIKTDNRLENLYWGSSSDNGRDAVRNNVHPQTKKTHCKHGHEYSEENTRFGTSGRICRTCHRIDERERSKRKREKQH